jgi:hypothetical protein
MPETNLPRPNDLQVGTYTRTTFFKECQRAKTSGGSFAIAPSHIEDQAI